MGGMGGDLDLCLMLGQGLLGGSTALACWCKDHWRITVCSLTNLEDGNRKVWIKAGSLQATHGGHRMNVGQGKDL